MHTGDYFSTLLTGNPLKPTFCQRIVSSSSSAAVVNSLEGQLLRIKPFAGTVIFFSTTARHHAAPLAALYKTHKIDFALDSSFPPLSVAVSVGSATNVRTSVLSVNSAEFWLDLRLKGTRPRRLNPSRRRSHAAVQH